MVSRENILYGVGAVFMSVSVFYSGYWYGGRNTDTLVDNNSNISDNSSNIKPDDDK